MTEKYRVVDRVERETAELLDGTDAILAYDETDVYVLEKSDDD